MNKIIDIGKTIAVNGDTNMAVFNILTAKGVTCKGVDIKSDGTLVINDPSVDDPKITTEEIQAEIGNIKEKDRVELMIRAEIRNLAIESLKKQGKIT